MDRTHGCQVSDCRWSRPSSTATSTGRATKDCSNTIWARESPGSFRSAPRARAPRSARMRHARSSIARRASSPGAPVFMGVGGNATDKVIRHIERLEGLAFEGIVSVCPYYNRPGQDGLLQHFTRIAQATDRPIVIYNIPYRTGVNLTNDTLLELAQLPTIVGVKDSCGSLAQSLDLLRRRPESFAVLTGEDAWTYTMLTHGADGGILASAHLATGLFVDIYERIVANDHRGARGVWSRLETLVPLLFKEANPMPIKYCLWRLGLIRSPECRLPLTRVSSALAAELDLALQEMAQEAAAPPGVRR